MTRVYLHIGAPKTGTTYLQEVLFRNRARLAEHGVLYPGDSTAAHYAAVLDLRVRHRCETLRSVVDSTAMVHIAIRCWVGRKPALSLRRAHRR
jgi:hypothetical protein